MFDPFAADHGRSSAAEPAFDEAALDEAELEEPAFDEPAFDEPDVAVFDEPEVAVFDPTAVAAPPPPPGAFATELQHLVPQLLERINGYLGYAAITRLKIERGRLPARKRSRNLEPAPLTQAETQGLQGELEPIGDEGLKQALDALGRAVKGLRRPANPAK